MSGDDGVRRFDVRTGSREELVNVTDRVRRVIAESGVEEGLAVLWSTHTTAGLTVNEAADPDVARDVSEWLEATVPRDEKFRHAEGNADSHVKTSLVGPGVTLIVTGGEPLLGRWQGVFLCEFDGPRTRTVAVRVLGA
jgi:secondary thiamine-phosphate synthase enzyme